MARGREHKIFAFEIANESWQNGFRRSRGYRGTAASRQTAERSNGPVLVALSAPATGATCDTYAGVRRRCHDRPLRPRQFGDEGPTAPLIRPWSVAERVDADCRGALPGIVLNNEPIGPESSVEQDDSPSRIAAAYVMTFLAGNAAYVLHTGPGIRGGGAADLGASPPRHAHFAELPSFESIATALAAARKYLPPRSRQLDAPRARRRRCTASWISNGSTPPRPAPAFVALAVGVGKGVIVRARVAASIEIRDAATGQGHQAPESGTRRPASLSPAGRNW